MHLIAFAAALLVSAGLTSYAANAETLQLNGTIKTQLAESPKCNYAFRYLEGWSGQSVDPQGNIHWRGMISFDPLITGESELPTAGLDISKATATFLPTSVRGCRIRKSDGKITGAASDRIFIWLEGKSCKALTDQFNTNDSMRMTFLWKNVPTLDGKSLNKNVSLTLKSEAQVCD
jgi:hypothetical protein